MSQPKKKLTKLPGKKIIAKRNRSGVPRGVPLPPPPDLVKAMSGGVISDLEVKPPAAGKDQSLLKKIDITPPGAGDAAAADRIDSPNKANKLKGTEKPRLAAGEFEFDKDDLLGIFQVWNLIIAGRCPKWILSDNEISALVKSLPPVLKKYLPEVAEYLPEVALLQTAAGIILTRINFSPAPEISMPAVVIPDPDKKPPAGPIHFEHLISEAEANAAEKK